MRLVLQRRTERIFVQFSFRSAVHWPEKKIWNAAMMWHWMELEKHKRRPWVLVLPCSLCCKIILPTVGKHMRRVLAAVSWRGVTVVQRGKKSSCTWIAFRCLKWWPSYILPNSGGSVFHFAVSWTVWLISWLLQQSIPLRNHHWQKPELKVLFILFI